MQPDGRQVGLFAYPWDIIDAGVGEFIDRCANLGVTEVHVATCYHTGKFLLPRNSRHRVYFPEPGCLYFVPSHDAFRHSLTPQISDLAATGWLDQLAVTAAKQKIRLAAWTVFFHNSSLGQRHPELTLRNLFGDPYRFGLCPTHSRVQEYAVDLCKSMEDTGSFVAIDVESIGYLGYDHGYHHEIDAIPLGPLERFLLSLCFCDGCRANATRAGIQIDALRETLKRITTRRFQCDHAAASDPQNAEEIATLLAVMPELQAFVALRCATIAGLIARLRAACPRCELNVFSSAFVGSPSNIWMEGINVVSVRNLIDRFVLLAYSNDPDAVKTDLLFCSSLVERASKLSLVLNLGLPATPSLSGASAIVQFALEQGIGQFAFFNYGLLGDGRLRWLRQLSDLIRNEAAAGDLDHNQ